MRLLNLWQGFEINKSTKNVLKDSFSNFKIFLEVSDSVENIEKIALRKEDN